MASRSSTFVSTCCGIGFASIACLVVCLAGCTANTQRVKQLQNENDRLIAEYRAQRDQITKLSEQLASNQNRLAESEKLLARQSPPPISRVSRVNDSGGGLSQGNLPPSRLPSSSSQTATSTGVSSSTSGPIGSNLQTPPDLHWRPMGKNGR